MKNKNTSLYLLNLALLITHEIDSAFWKEWELFGMQGDIQEFLVVNFLIMLAALIGFRNVISRNRSGFYFALILASSGIFAFGIHTYFILTGHQEFTLFVSIVILIATLIVSLLQGVLAIQSLREKY
jgi:cytochrome c oxidase subunit IV